MALVDVVDEVLDRLESAEELRFTLDGQLATVDDYLEIRPEAEDRIRRLVGAGRLALGPWQTLMDEFLVDGETTLRNLEAGLRRSGRLGGADARRLPPGHVRARRADAADPARGRASRMRSSGGEYRLRSTSTASSGKGSTGPRSSPNICRTAMTTPRTSSTFQAPSI